MSYRYRTRAFIFSKDNLRETDQVFGLYSRDFGKLNVLGKGIRKIKSKLRPGAELFYLSEIEFIQGKLYKTLTDASVINKFKKIRKDLDKMKTAYQIAEFFKEAVGGQEKDEKLFNLLNDSFDRLDKSLDSQLLNFKLYHYFFWNLLSLLGYRIDLHSCVRCHKKLSSQDNLYFNKGVFCCSQQGEKISPNIVKILRIITEKNWELFSKIKIDNYKKKIDLISQNYIKVI